MITAGDWEAPESTVGGIDMEAPESTVGGIDMEAPGSTVGGIDMEAPGSTVGGTDMVAPGSNAEDTPDMDIEASDTDTEGSTSGCMKESTATEVNTKR